MSNFDQLLLNDALLALGVDHLKPLSRGGQKAVYLVQRVQETLVLKVISVPSQSAEAFRRADREVDLLRAIDHANVVRVVSPLVELGNPVRGAAWLEEYLDGEDLFDLLFHQAWSWSDTAQMAFEVASGLAAGHDRAVVHRDLSARNVRRLSAGTYKVMDFGFARHTLRSGLTIAGQPGTPGYASPEHLRSYSGAPTAASDVFAVGILMFAALTTALPIPYNGDDSLYGRQLRAVTVPDLKILRPDLLEDQVSLVHRCMHRQPARRYLNGRRLAESLERLR